jgi:hypothetical protein
MDIENCLNFYKYFIYLFFLVEIISISRDKLICVVKHKISGKMYFRRIFDEHEEKRKNIISNIMSMEHPNLLKIEEIIHCNSNYISLFILCYFIPCFDSIDGIL